MNKQNFHSYLKNNLSFNSIYISQIILLSIPLVFTSFYHHELGLKLLALFTTIILIEISFYLSKKVPSYWLHSLLTGVYLSFLLSFSLPWIAFIIIPIFSIGVYRLIFGINNYWLNPALLGFIMALSIWPNFYLDLFKEKETFSLISTFLENYPATQLDKSISALLNSSPIFENLFINLPSGYINLLQGNLMYNYISPLWILMAIILLWRRFIVKWIISIVYLLVFLVLVYLFEGKMLWGDTFFMGDALFFFLSPIGLLAIFFLAVENQTSPVNMIEMVIYGILNALFSFTFLFLWVSPYSLLLGVCMAQVLWPLFNINKILYKIYLAKMERSRQSFQEHEINQKGSES